MAREIGVVTTSRGDYGILRPVLEALAAHEDLRPRVFAADGASAADIEADGFELAARIDAVEIGTATTAFGQAFTAARPDIVLVLGDEFATHAAALATVPLRLPLAHVHGGEITEGRIEDALRHAITMLSHLHFPATADAERRIKQLGEEDWRILQAGAPGIDTVRGLELLPREREDDYVLVTYYPVTRRDDESPEAMLAALADLDLDIVIAQPDGNGDLARFARFAEERPGTELVVDAGLQRYFSLMHHSCALVGNSSSGIIEAASFELPVVDVGSRQRGRTRGENVLTAIDDASAIAIALEEALDPAFRATLAGMTNPYGDGEAGPRIAERLAVVELDDRLLLKRFQDR